MDSINSPLCIYSVPTSIVDAKDTTETQSPPLQVSQSSEKGNKQEKIDHDECFGWGKPNMPGNTKNVLKVVRPMGSPVLFSPEL